MLASGFLSPLKRPFFGPEQQVYQHRSSSAVTVLAARLYVLLSVYCFTVAAVLYAGAITQESAALKVFSALNMVSNPRAIK